MSKEDTFIIFDIETDGFLNKVSAIHCLSYQVYYKGNIIEKNSLTNYNDISRLLDRDAVFVGHNIIRYDFPVLEKILKHENTNEIVDTLGISWYLYPKNKKHGLEFWGEELNVPKPIILDWENQSIEDYIYRCEIDVEINTLLFRKQMSYLSAIYNDNMEDITRLIEYCNFKLDCLRVQEAIGITLDVEKCNYHLSNLRPLYENKVNILSSIMPKDLGKVIKTKPKVMVKKDGTPSANAEKWYEYLSELGLPDTTTEIREKPNPGSDTQLKEWLFRIGWKPITFKESKQTGEKIPQVSLPFGGGICPSVKELFEDNPGLEELDSMYKIKHRIGVFESYLENVDENGKVYATANGFTNTMRLTHSKPVVNLPKPGVFYGTEIREVLTVPNDKYTMIGSDISGLEDNTKQHYIYFYDPDYVKEMRVPGFDPHIDIGKLAGLITQEEEDFFKRVEAMSDEDKTNLTEDEKTLLKSIKKRRGTAKSTNFAATYGAGGPKIAETAKVSLSEGNKLHKIYWQRNWAVKKTAEDAVVKTVNNQKWLFNPISKLWMFLKAEKDRFSTLNQSSGVWVFDTWVKFVREALEKDNIYVILQYHDEILLVCPNEYVDHVKTVLKEAMNKTNSLLKLNVEISNSIEVGSNYSECH